MTDLARCLSRGACFLCENRAEKVVVVRHLVCGTFGTYENTTVRCMICIMLVGAARTRFQINFKIKFYKSYTRAQGVSRYKKNRGRPAYEVLQVRLLAYSNNNTALKNSQHLHTAVLLSFFFVFFSPAAGGGGDNFELR